MTYDLASTLDRERFAARVSYLLDKGAAVELTEKVQRSLSQNNYLHAIIGAVAMETGNTLAYAKEFYFKRIANHDLFVRDVDDPYAGRVQVLRSSADLTKEEMSLAIDRFKKWAAEQGMYLPDPEDEALLSMIQVEMGKVRKYL